MKKKTITSEYAPYKSYIWGLIQIPHGWKDLGKKGYLSKSLAGEGWTTTQWKACAICRERVRIGKHETGILFEYCPICKRWWTV